MWIPPQGFQHAATLLLTNRTRAIQIDASANGVQTALEQLASELIALARDMRVREDVTGWLIAEFNSTIDRLPQSFDRTGAKAAGAEILARVSVRPPDTDPRDLFLIYVPEDRLPVAAPLAVELTKRRVSVSFAEYEVATALEFAGAVAHGLALHRRGAVLWTTAFDRTGWEPPAETDRFRILHEPAAHSAVAALTAWVHRPTSEK
jgi:hypothetical protein